jgi:hypothetical protein
MRLDVRGFALAGGITAALLFGTCAFAVALAPDATTAFAGDLIHTDLSGFQRTLTWGSFFRGLVSWTIGTALVFALVAWTYNRVAPRQPMAA